MLELLACERPIPWGQDNRLLTAGLRYVHYHEVRSHWDLRVRDAVLHSQCEPLELIIFRYWLAKTATIVIV